MCEHLTSVELQFLVGLGRDADDVFDARGLPQWLWKERAKEAGKDIVLGSRCRKAGHRLRTRGGHCVQCDTSKLGFTTRYSSTGWVYVAGSLQARLMKIGMCVDYDQRERQMRAERYGECGDWRILYYVKVHKAGEVERSAHDRLRRYVVNRTYYKGGVGQEAIELLACSYSQAEEALNTAIEGRTLLNFGSRGDWKQYEF